jgi:glutamine amidotransferase-like uncharacterized protein
MELFSSHNKFLLAMVLLLSSFSLVGVGCGSGTANGATSSDPVVRGARAFSTDILLYNGSGVWSPEVASLRGIFNEHGASFDEVSSDELNAMSAEELGKYGAIVWPGGLGGTQSASLTTQTKDNLRKAVREQGVGYIGFCAGAFVAVSPTPASGKAPSYGLSIVDGTELPYYYLESDFERSGETDIAMTLETFADGSTRDLVWYGGPVVTSGANSVIAKYPNGDAAISQMWSGNGWVILSAVHPTAPQSVRDTYALDDADGTDLDLAWKLVDAAVHQTALLVF